MSRTPSWTLRGGDVALITQKSVFCRDECLCLPEAEQPDLVECCLSIRAEVTEHEYGIAERDAKNNHGTCWVVQAGEFARLTGRGDLTAFCRGRVKDVIMPQQMAADGSFPLERARTKPYGYSLFNLDAMATACQILSTADDNLWTFELADGRGMRKALAFMAPFIADKTRWPHKPDVMYHDGWPVRHVSLLFGGLTLNRSDYITLWRRLDPDPTVDEIIRNYPIRQPVLWV